jgi:hypothetical protein
LFAPSWGIPIERATDAIQGFQDKGVLHPPNSMKILLPLIGLAFGLAACGTSVAPAAQSSSVQQASTPSTPSSTPTPTATASTSVSCAPGPDLIVREVSPGLAPTAIALGSNGYDARTNSCQDTIVSLQQTSPTGPGYCTTAALASDNPGYESAYVYATNPPPAPPLKKVIISIPAGCS